jgi:hypothetical protein
VYAATAGLAAILGAGLGGVIAGAVTIPGMFGIGAVLSGLATIVIAIAVREPVEGATGSDAGAVRLAATGPGRDGDPVVR